MATGALLVLVMGLSLALIPVVLFPILRQVDEVLAVGYPIIRGAVETAIYIILAITLLLLALSMYGVIDSNSSGQNLLQLPLGVQEMVLAIWMIARGFRPARRHEG